MKNRIKKTVKDVNEKLDDASRAVGQDVNLSGFNSPKLCFVIYYLNGRKQLYT